MATTALTPAATYRSGLYEWITTTDHKKIGILYVDQLVRLLLHRRPARPRRAERARGPGHPARSPSDVYNQLFTMHASLMLFLFVIPMLAGFGNYAVPLMIGAPDMAFPRINALSFWMLPLAGILLLHRLPRPGGAAAAGWTSYPPLSETGLLRRPDRTCGSWRVLLIGTSSILGGINFLVTIFKMRAPGHDHVPDADHGLDGARDERPRRPGDAGPGQRADHAVHRPQLRRPLLRPGAAAANAVLWQNVFWFYSHPAVYIMILPAMGIVSEVLPVFSRKPLFGYKAFVFATAGIGALGFSVWAHHMFTTGSVYLPFFSLMTFLIAVPTGVKMFNWIATLLRGQLTFSTPLLFALGFLTMFLIGGINGAFSAGGAGRLRPPRHVLGRRPPPLRAVRRLGVRGLRRDLLLVPQDDRPDAQRDPGQDPVRAHVHRLQPDLLPDAHPRASTGMPRRIADYAADRRLEPVEPRSRRSAAS